MTLSDFELLGELLNDKKHRAACLRHLSFLLNYWPKECFQSLLCSVLHEYLTVYFVLKLRKIQQIQINRVTALFCWSSFYLTLLVILVLLTGVTNILSSELLMANG